MSSNGGLVDQAADAIKKGDITGGRSLLQTALKTNPGDVWALLWMTKCTEDPYEKAAWFRAANDADPKNRHAVEGCWKYRRYLPSRQAPHTSSTMTSRPRHFSCIILLICGGLVLVPWLLYNLVFVPSATRRGPNQQPSSPPPTSNAACGQAEIGDYLDRLVLRQSDLNADLDIAIAAQSTEPSFYTPLATRAERRYNAQRADPQGSCLPEVQNKIVSAFHHNWQSLEAATDGDWQRSADLMTTSANELATLQAAFLLARDLYP